jgi:hypothetical protein
MIATYSKNGQEESAFVRCFPCRNANDPKNKNRQGFQSAQSIASFLLLLGCEDQACIMHAELLPLSQKVKPIMEGMFRQSAFHTIWANFLLLRAEGLIENVDYIVTLDAVDLKGRDDRKNKEMQDQTRLALTHLARMVIGTRQDHLHTVLTMSVGDLKALFFPRGRDPHICPKKAASQLSYWLRLCGIVGEFAFNVPPRINIDTGVFQPQTACTQGMCRLDSDSCKWVEIWKSKQTKKRKPCEQEDNFEAYMTLLARSLERPHEQVWFVIPSLIGEMNKKAEVPLQNYKRREKQLTLEEVQQFIETAQTFLAKNWMHSGTNVHDMLEMCERHQLAVSQAEREEGGSAGKKKRKRQNAQPQAGV